MRCVSRLPDVRAMGRKPLVGLLAVVATTLAGCTSSGHHELLIASGSPGKPYNGPLYVPIVSTNPYAPVLDRSGAAGRALDCIYRPYAGGRGAYHDGLLEVAATYVRAAEAFMTPNSGAFTLPPDGYRVARHAGNRVLLSYDVRGRIKAAIILRDGITDYQQHTGWGVETWAVCDPAEYPAELTDALGIGVWQDRRGRRVPVTQVESFPGDDFCDYSGVDYLQTGRYPREEFYVHDADGQLTRYLTLPYDDSSTLPEDAIDTGFHRDGRELWFPPDRAAAYLVSQSDANDVQRWPGFKHTFGCG